jgi:hypothetical protein
MCCNAVSFGDSPTFRRNISLPSSWSMSKPGKKETKAYGEMLVTCLYYSSPLKRRAAYELNGVELRRHIHRRDNLTTGKIM